jgi:Uma2 family endonuclease
MGVAALHLTSLDQFSQLPNIEESPAWEFFDGLVLQKNMPTFHHSRLQKRLVAAIDNADSPYEAFPELRCILSQNSIVPDITVIHPSRIPTHNEPINGAPNWLIEILSPDQSTTKLIAKIQACLSEGNQLGWLIDSQAAVIMILLPNHTLHLLSGETILPVLDDISLQLTPNQIFGWLQP